MQQDYSNERMAEPRQARQQARACTPDTGEAAGSAVRADGAPAGEDAADREELAAEAGFAALGLRPEVLRAVEELGFEVPTPIQERAIPLMLSGRDMLGQAQTGTGKTAAFGLPILSRIDCGQRCIQALVLEPTRELALQVAEACQSFARHLDGFRVAPIYGGASYENQIRALRHGVQLVVGTPGRLIDLIRRGTLDFTSVRHLVIDEADEMLRMGFIEDVDWILGNTPEQRQTVLFSATMPPAVARIAGEHLKDPADVRIQARTATATTVRQRYWVASEANKLDAMTRILEVESYEGVLVFVRTKTDVEDVANRLMARGLACAALHGDIPQRQREKIVERLKNGSLDIIIATDVAARGLDVDRITHVFNYDIPHDVESYVHRIGRTGRAGRTGEAILFVSPREGWALRQIERATRQKLEPLRLPTAADINRVRLENFKSQIFETIAQGGLEQYVAVVSELLAEDAVEPEILAAALAKMCQRDGGALLLDESQPEPGMGAFEGRFAGRTQNGGPREDGRQRGPSAQAQPLRDFPDIPMQRYRVAVGRRDGVKPGQIVGAIANQGGLDGRHIGQISMFDTFSVVDLPAGLPEGALHAMAAARVCGRALELRRYAAEPPRKRPGRIAPRVARRGGNAEADRKKRHREARPDARRGGRHEEGA